MNEKRTIVRFSDGYNRYNTKLTEKQIDLLYWLSNNGILAEDVRYDIIEKEEEFEEP